MGKSRLEGKVALITGGARGMGASEAQLFIDEGARVVISDVLDSVGQETAKRLSPDGSKCVFLHHDVTSEDDWNAVVASVLETFGQIDILVNNAGVTRDNLTMRMKDEEWDDVIRINLEATFRLMRAATKPMMKARFGRIITITSVVGTTGNPGQANYAASKGGLTAMTKAIAQELASRNVTANCVAPGFIATAMTENLPDAQKEALNARIPMGRMGEGADIGAAVAYLASREAGYVTGQTIHVNGGMAML